MHVRLHKAFDGIQELYALPLVALFCAEGERALVLGSWGLGCLSKLVSAMTDGAS